MTKLFLVPLLLLCGSPLQAQSFSLILPTNETYQSGRALYEEQKSIVHFENGFFTSVPVDYNNPNSETFEIYSWFAGEFQAHLPTVIYLTGGPGQGSHWGQGALESKKYNLLLVDQRGIALSKPSKKTTYLNPQFYNSEWTARDLEVLRKKLDISSWSIYAVSYGTIPATIYASKFPATTRALVLEGTAFSAQQLATFQEKKKIINQAIQAQNLDVQKLIYGLQFHQQVNSTWFFQWARDTLLLNEGAQTLNDQLALLQDKKAYSQFVELLENQYTPQAHNFSNDLFGLNEIPYYMVSCQELGLSKASTMTDLQFHANQIIEIRNPNRDQICQSLQAKSIHLYDASLYPVTVPVTYFQGENDSATEINGAYMHYQKVAGAAKQMLVMKNGGHNPNLQQLTYDVPGQREIVEKALAGEKVTVELVEQANRAETSLQWYLINK